MTNEQLALYLQSLSDLLYICIENVETDLNTNGVTRHTERIFIGDPTELLAQHLSSQSGANWEERESTTIDNLNPLRLFVIDLSTSIDKLLGKTDDNR